MKTKRNRVKRAWGPLAAVLAALCAPALADDAASARHAIALAGRTDCPRGIALAPEGGTLALELAAAGEFTVLAQAPDDAAAGDLRQRAYDAGTGGRRLYAAVSPADRFVASERVVDLLALAGLTDDALGRLDPAEVARVLAPELGRAVLGHATGAPGSLSRAALERWTQAGGMPSRIVEDGHGLWAVLSPPALKGADDWTHWFHGAGGNAVSKDTAFADPFQLAWTAKPYVASRLQTRAAAGGRLFNIFRRHQKEGMFQTHNFEGSNELVARNIHNGEILWRFPLPPDEVYTQRSSLIATPAEVFVMRASGVQVLDAATGAERRWIAFPGVAGRPKWMCLEGGVLVCLVGSDDVPEFSPTANVMKTVGLYKELTEAGQLGFGRNIVAVDAATGATLWRHTEEAPVDGRVFGVSPGGTVVAYALRSRVFALGLRTGRPLWEQKSTDVLAALAERQASEAWGWNAVSGPGLACDDRVAAIAHAGSGKLVVLSMADGRLLWTAKHTVKWGGPIRFVLWGDRLVSVHNSSSPAADLLTGATVPLPGDAARDPGLASCGGFTATARYGMGLNGPAVDLTDGRRLLPFLTKADCEVANMVASGTFVQAPPACSVCNRVYGFLAMRRFPGDDLRRPASDADRLVTVRGAASTAETAGAPDWPTYRADLRRSGASAAALPASARVRWTWRPAQPFAPAGVEGHYAIGAEHRATAPVAVGDRVYVAATDGSVTALSAADGKERWRFLAGARIMSAPAFANGRLYAGGADGHLYCLDAATGDLLWRFRVAPHERRTMIYGHLSSLWPITGTPVVADGVVYAAAGQPMSAGGYVVALNAADGRRRWERSFVPYSGDEASPALFGRSGTPAEKLWVSPWGQMALANGRLHVRVRNSTGVAGLALDAATGEVLTTRLADQTAGRDPYMRGQDIGILPDGRLASGGLEPEYDQSGPQRLARTLAISTLEENGTNMKSGRPARLPAWNERVAVLPLYGYAQGLAAMATAGLGGAFPAQSVGGKPAADPTASDKESQAPAAVPLWGPLSPDGGPCEDKYGKRGAPIVAVALAANGAVVVCPAGAAPDKSEFGWTKPWKAARFSLEDGARAWEVALPGPAVLDGLCIGRDGTAYVTLLDGGVCAVGAE
jgi:outer membrane protein assembly factor BamB